MTFDIKYIAHSLIIEIIGHSCGTCKFVLLHAFAFEISAVRVPVLQPWRVLVWVNTTWVTYFLPSEDSRTVLSFVRGIRRLDLVVLAKEIVWVQSVEHPVDLLPILSAYRWLF